MPITVRKTYAARAERDLLCDPHPFSKELSAQIGSAAHFSLPLDGCIMEDNCKGLIGATLRLPFPVVTASFNMARGDGRLIVIAKEFEDITMLERKGVIKFAVAAFDGKMFRRIPYHSFMPFDADIGKELSGTPIYAIFDDNNLKRSLPSGNAQIDNDDDLMLGLLCVAHMATLELLEALSCSNVTHEPIEKIDPKVNARRIRDGKLPLYETRCLIINAGKQTSKSAAHGGTHASPRQHLRRGHIRRLPTGNVWVNSCVVSANSPLGKIEKSYWVTT